MNGGKWQRGALREAVIRELGAAVRPPESGLSARELARQAGWTPASVRRELAMMEQLGLVRSWTAKRPALWSLTRGGRIVWYLATQGAQRTPVLARSMGVSAELVTEEAARLVHLGLIRGHLVSEVSREWRLAGKAAP